MLADFIKVNKLSAQIFECEDAHTAARVGEITGDPDAVAKSILLIGSDNEPLLVILLGKDKIDFAKIKKALNVSDVRLAAPKEVLEITGYEVGGVPPISIYGVRTLMDKSAAEKQEVVCGGGDAQHLMRIKIKEIFESVEGILVEDIKKEPGPA